MIDLDDNRLRVAKDFGATALINSADGSAVERVLEFTGGEGVDVAVEAVGMPATFDICQSILALSGRLANVGVHGTPVKVHVGKLWNRKITLTTRLVDTATTSMLMKVVGSGKLQPPPFRSTACNRQTHSVRSRFCMTVIRAVTTAAFVLLSLGAGVVAGTPRVGDRAPDFTLAQIDGTRLTLSSQLKAGPVVLIVGRGWVGYQCPFCNRQFGEFLKAAPEIEAAGARVMWIYPGPAEDVQQRATEFVTDKPFPANFRFVLDPNYALTEAYGLRWNAPQETAYPSTFVIDRGGTVRYALVSKTHGGRSTTADVLAELKKLQ